MLVLCLPLWGESFRTVPLYRGGSFITLQKQIAVREFRDGGLPEIAACADGLVFTYTKSGTDYVQTWIAPARCSAMTVGDLDGDGRSEIITAGTAGLIAIYDPSTMAAPRTITISGTPNIVAIAVGNVDNDPAPEIVAVTAANTYVYDGGSLALEWTATGRTGSSVAIAEIDGDAKNEIILGSSSDGTVLDAYTQTFKWGYVGGFGTPFTTADVDGDGKAEILGYFSSSSQIRILNGDTFTTTSFSGYGDSALLVGDANNDGTDEIVGVSYYNGIHGYNKSTGVVSWTSNYSYYSVSSAAIGDPDGDGLNELVLASGSVINILNVALQNPTEATITGASGPFRVAAGDLDGDGRREVVTALNGYDSYYGSPSVEIRDGQTGAVRGRLTLPTGFRVYRIAIGNVDSDPAREIVLLGSTYYGDTYLYTFDGITYASEYTSPAPTYNGPNIYNGGLLVANVDGDAVDEIIVGRSDARFEVLNGASNVVQYVSEPLDGGVYDLALADTNADTIKDLVIGTSNGLYVLRASDWTQRTHITISYPGAHRVAAGDGEILYAAGYNYSTTDTLVALAGDTLTERWRCTSFPAYINDLTYATINGVERGVAATNFGSVRLIAKNGNACPTTDEIPLSPSAMYQAVLADVTGDGQPEIVGGFQQHYEVDALSPATLPRGDVDGDGQVTDADMDALALYLYNGGLGAPATADVNGDGCILADDLFYLINYRRGTGAAPPQ